MLTETAEHNTVAADTTDMKNFQIASAAFLATAILVLAGCANHHGLDVVRLSDSSRMQGAWTGRELAAKPEGEGPSHFTIAGDAFEFRGTNTNEWYKGTFTLRENANPKQILITVKDTPSTKFIGKTSHGIYRFDGDKFILTANAPGDEDWPAAFGVEASLTIEFTK